MAPSWRKLIWTVTTCYLSFLDQAADAGFTANWAADFGSSATTGTEESGNAQPAVDGQGWPPAEAWPTEAVSQPQEEAATDEVRAWNPEYFPEPKPDCDPCAVGGDEAKQQHPEQEKESVEEGQPDWAKNQVEWAEEKAGCRSEERDTEETVGLQPMPGIIFTNELGQEIQGVGGDSSIWGLSSQVDVDGSGSEYETAEEWGDVPGQNCGWVSADDELECAENENPVVAPEHGTVAQECFTDWGTADGVLEQITPADSGFGGDAFAANWDQQKATPCVSELEDESLDDPLSDPAKAGANTPQNVLESIPSSDPFDTESNDPFGTGDDPFAASGDDPFGLGNHPFSNSDQDPSGFSGSDPFATTDSNLLDTEGLSTESPKSGFHSDPFAETKPGGEGQWAADPLPLNSHQTLLLLGAIRTHLLMRSHLILSPMKAVGTHLPVRTPRGGQGVGNPLGQRRLVEKKQTLMSLMTKLYMPMGLPNGQLFLHQLSTLRTPVKAPGRR